MGGKNSKKEAKGRGDFQKTIVMRDKDKAIVCAAIDFGATCCGYAYSFKHEPEKVYINYLNEKYMDMTPAAVLMSPNKEVHSFGQEAWTNYMQKMKTNEHVDWFLFERFNMKLLAQNGPLDKNMLLKDYTGKTMPAIYFFAVVIKHMTEHLKKVLSKGRNSVGEFLQLNENDIHWVLTVPAIWNDLCEDFMRQAANKAGIPNHMLTLALEPVAASLFCKKNLPVQNGYVGCRSIVLDLGSETAVITCHEVNHDGSLKELHEPTGAAFGGTSVDNKFFSVLNSIFGAKILNEFKTIHPLDYWELVNDFGFKKRTYDGSVKMSMRFNTTILDLYQEKSGQDVMESIENSPIKGMVEFKHGKISIARKLSNEIFDEAVVPIRKATETLYRHVGDIDCIILVGGFSESPYVQRVMKENFQNLNIVIPSDPSGAVVKGAVIYGHESKAEIEKKPARQLPVSEYTLSDAFDERTPLPHSATTSVRTPLPHSATASGRTPLPHSATISVRTPLPHPATASGGTPLPHSAKTSGRTPLPDSAKTLLLDESHTRSGSKAALQKTVIQRKKKAAFICAAIDFGTTYSGYAYSFQANPQVVLSNYFDGLHIKTPTIVLMSPDGQLHSFGQEAKDYYMEKMKTKEHEEWFLFERFKMKLFVQDAPLVRDMMLEDYTGKKMLAIEVIAAAIKYMKDHLLKVLNDNKSPSGETKEIVEIRKVTDIHWVLTVPAIWDDLSKVFMRQAANKAGIPNDMLTLALEPEAASLFCKKDLGEQKSYVGFRYITLDLGGGTADITCHEVNPDETLKELHEPVGGPFGGTVVDNKFINVLNSIFGADIMKQFKKKRTLEYWEIIKDFEVKKRNYDGSGTMVMKFPSILLELYRKRVDEDVMETINNSPKKGLIEFKQDKVIIETDMAKEMFDEAVVPILKATEQLYDSVDNIDCIILVGGFSESPYVQKVMIENFQNLNIVIPSDPSGAVVKGAVIYGHETKAIASRVCKFTYGIARTENFKDHIHPKDKKVFVGGKAMCDDIFKKHIEKGEVVNVNMVDDVNAHVYFPSFRHMHQVVLEVYASTEKNPKFTTDDECHFVGLIKADIDPKGDFWAKIFVKIIFGGTELIVEVADESNENVTQGAVDFFG